MVGEMNISWPEEGGDKAIELLQVSCSSNSRAKVNVAQISTKPFDIDGTTINCCSRSGQVDLRHVTCFILRPMSGPDSRVYLRNLAVDNLDIIVSWGISSHQAATHMMQ